MTMLSELESSEKCGVIVGAAVDLVGNEDGLDLRRRTAPHPPRCLIVEMRILVWYERGGRLSIKKLVEEVEGDCGADNNKCAVDKH
jgi:hypothetical protein